MKPYMIIEGSNQAIDSFEKKVADALGMGYTLGGELVTHSHSSNNEVKFYQSVILAEEDDEYEDEDYEDEEEDDN